MTEMETFYEFHKFFLSIVGLWPYNRSKFLLIKNSALILFTISFIIPQCIPFTKPDVTVYVVLKNLSAITMCLAALLKYTVFWYQTDIMKEFLDVVKRDWIVNQGEGLKVLKKHASLGKYYGKLFASFIYPSSFALVILDVSYVVAYFITPRNETYAYNFPIEMEYIVDKKKYYLPIVTHRSLAVLIIATIFVATESVFFMLLQHCASLFSVTSERIVKAVTEASSGYLNDNEKSPVNDNRATLVTAIFLHRRAMKFARELVIRNTASYSILIIVGVTSLSANLYRLSQSLGDPTMLEESLTALLFISSELAYMFYLNYMVQQMTDCMENLIPLMYNTEWYKASLDIQKSLLIFMLKGKEEYAFTFYGLYHASIEGFSVNSEISLFETNIRFMGSLLACYALTGDVMFRDKAAQLGERMLPAFQTETGIPHSLINLHTGASKNYGWASSGCSILSEIGTMHLEFTYLSDITGNPVFKSKVENVRKVLKNLEKPKGLYPNYIHPKTGKWGQHHMSLGGLGDSFYEYLLKAWIQSGKEDIEARQMYDEAIVAIDQHMIKMSPGNLLYVSDLKYDRLEHKMGHLACFAGGMFALGARTLQNEISERYMTIAAGLTNTCHESYDRSYTKLGPEAFHFIEGNEAKSLKNGEKYYILRPETFESYFVMWRLTKDPKYREWGWEAVQALEKYCRVPGGFTGLHNVYLVDPPQDDVQQSYFFAETLKYLYLLFSDDDLINLDDWVFNSEAHVLPIRGNPLYRPAPSL